MSESTAKLLEAAFSDHRTNKLDDAAKKYNEVLQIEPENAHALFLLGSLWCQRQIPQRALPLLLKAREFTPEKPELHNSLSQAYLLAGDLPLALQSIDECLRLKNDNPMIWCNRANILMNIGDFPQALASFEKAQNLDRKNPSILVQIGHLFRRLARSEQAEKAFQAALRIDEKNLAALNGLGLVHRDEGRFEASEMIFEDQIRFHPEQMEARLHLATQHRMLKNYDAALSELDVILKKFPNLPDAHLEKSYTLLLKEDFKEGFREYEWRLAGTNLPALQNVNVWKGEDIANKNIFITFEQSFAEQILFSSLLVDIAEKAKSIAVVCDERLIPLLQASFPKISFYHPKNLESLPNKETFDYQAPIATFARVYRREENLFPKTSWLTPPVIDDKNAIQLASDPSLKIGICWRHYVDPRRDPNPALRLKASVPLMQWLPLFKTSGKSFYSLQPGPAEAEINAFLEKTGESFQRFENLDFTQNLSTLAAVISKLDLVIGIYSTPILLAAALGKKTLILSTHDAHPLLGNRENPLALPNAKQFFQKTPGSWEEVVLEAGRGLKK